MIYYIVFNLILMIIGCFLPWLHAALFVVRLRGIDMLDGKVVFGLATASFLWILYQRLTGVTMPANRPPPLDAEDSSSSLPTGPVRPQWPLPHGVVGLAVVAITGLDLYVFYKNRYPIGPGIYLSFLGGAQLVGCFLRERFSATPPYNA